MNTQGDIHKLLGTATGFAAAHRMRVKEADAARAKAAKADAKEAAKTKGELKKARDPSAARARRDPYVEMMHEVSHAMKYAPVADPEALGLFKR